MTSWYAVSAEDAEGERQREAARGWLSDSQASAGDAINVVSSVLSQIDGVVGGVSGTLAGSLTGIDHRLYGLLAQTREHLSSASEYANVAQQAAQDESYDL